MLKSLVIPPPLLFVACAALMWFMPNRGETPPLLWLAALLVLISAVIALSALFIMKQRKTTVDPFKLEKTSFLIMHGIYRYSRNPMYLSLAVSLMAWAVWLENPLSWPGVFFFIWIMQKGQIAREEQFLMQKFGKEFEQYCGQTRRWI